ncbi:type II secretion system protein [Anaerohalosphaera lusitana]|nr:type II secretion system protein [Anaerohalosphaera lusitana]
MRACDRKSGFTLVEALTVIAVIGVLVSLVLGLGKSLKEQADERLANSTIEVLVTAIEQYLEFTSEFPFEADVSFNNASLESVLESQLGLPDGTVTVDAANPPEYASSEALFYVLDNCARSKGFVDSLSGGVTTNKDAAGSALVAEYGDIRIDLVRIVDPWGNALQYTYSAGDVFPELRFAGPDKELFTQDDVTSE